MTVKLAVGGGRSLIVTAGRALVALAQPVASAIGTASAASVVASRRDAVMTMRRVQAGRGSGRRLPAWSPHDVIVPDISVGAPPDEFTSAGKTGRCCRGPDVSRPGGPATGRPDRCRARDAAGRAGSWDQKG
jgi:hypothetical protein